MQLRHVLSVRLPVDVVEYLRERAEQDASSQNSVIVRAVREMKQRAERLPEALPTDATALRRVQAAEARAVRCCDSAHTAT